MVERREFLMGAGLGGALALTGCAQPEVAEDGSPDMTAEAASLYEEIRDLPFDDNHCHPLTDADAETTPQAFLERISLAAFPASSYFPAGVYERWQRGDAGTRTALDRQYGIQAVIDEITYHAGESIFIKALVKELASFLQCSPTLDDVIAARNERGRADYWQYVNSCSRTSAPPT